MIKVNYWSKDLRLTVEGHAQSETLEGNPRVCSAASILVYALMNAMDGFMLRKWAKCAYFDNGSGMAYMRATKVKWHKFKAVRVAFGMTYGGLCILAKHYPDLVKTEVCNGRAFDDKKAIEDALEKGGEKV